MDNLSPVLIPTLNRYDHFKNCIDSLSRCVHSEKTELYIALDYPLKDSHWEGYNKIRGFLDHITGFKAVHIIKREVNYGGIKNLMEGEKMVLEQHDTIIISEDDNTFSPNFLDFINKGLGKFREDPRVVAICGYNYPIQAPQSYHHNYYYYQTFSAWGYGRWRDKMKTFFYSPVELSAFASNFSYVRKLYSITEQEPVRILECIKNNMPLYGDEVVSLENVKNRTYCIFPIVSKVKNNGHDGTGENCGKSEDDIFSRQDIDTGEYFNYDENSPPITTEISKPLKKYFRPPFKRKIKLILLYILFKLNLLKAL